MFDGKMDYFITEIVECNDMWAQFAVEIGTHSFSVCVCGVGGSTQR